LALKSFSGKWHHGWRIAVADSPSHKLALEEDNAEVR
jgi:hypothetical protein